MPDAPTPPASAVRSPDVRSGVRAVLAAVALALLAVPFGLLLLLVQSRWRPLLHLDDGVRDGLHGYAADHARFVTVMQALSTIGSTSAYLVVFTTVAGWLVWRRLPRLALFVVVTTVGSSLLNSAVKAAVDRARPVLPDPVAHANGLSFPSGHAQSAMVAYSVLLLIFCPVLRGLRRRVAVMMAVVMVVAIGFSRVALGVHYLSDVLAGYAFGAAWVVAMTAVFSAWRRETGQRGGDLTQGSELGQAACLAVRDAGERDPERAPGAG